jgi:uncharacterized protein YbbC (DUF1343 family)
MAEMALMFNHVFQIESDLAFVPMDGWDRRLLWADTGLRWIMPSPNMPLPETAQVYPGQVIWEGTNLSEGRGTCRPFEIFGAPYLDTALIKQKLSADATAGCYLQEVLFRPTFNKWEGESCHGFMIHVLDPLTYRPFFTTMALLRVILGNHGDRFAWKDPPYEYEFEKLPIDIILGDSELRRKIEGGTEFSLLEDKYLVDLNDFLEWRRSYLLY